MISPLIAKTVNGHTQLQSAFVVADLKMQLDVEESTPASDFTPPCIRTFVLNKLHSNA